MTKKTLLVVSLAAVAVVAVAIPLTLQEHQALQVNAKTAFASNANPDLASRVLCDYSVPSVATEAKAIADSVPAGATNRDTRIATAARDWVVSHIGFQAQSQPSPADVTLQTHVGNDASMSALIAAMLRSYGIPAEVQLVPAPTANGYYADSMPMRYVVMATLGNGNGLELDTPYQHRQPQPITDAGTLPW